MKRLLGLTLLAAGSVLVQGCAEQAEKPPIKLVDEDSPILGVWFMQAAGEQPVAIDSTIRFEFKADGEAVYERAAGGPEEPDRFELTYHLAGDILSVDAQGDAEAPGVPRITGKVLFEDESQTLRITTHTDEDWLLTRAKLPGGAIEDARRFVQFDNRADTRLMDVQRLAYACLTFASRTGEPPQRPFDLVQAGLIEPEQLLASGKASGLPNRFPRMTEQEQGAWLDANTDYVFYFEFAGSNQASSVVVSTVPERGDSQVVVGMANGAVFKKSVPEAAQLLEFQSGELPDAWPSPAWSAEATAGVEPLSD